MAWNFDGLDDWFSTVATPVTAAPLTLAGWFKSDADALHTVLSVADSAAADEFLLWGESLVIGKNLNMRATQTSPADAGSTGTYADNVWSHMGGTAVSTTERYAYLDGVQSAVNAVSKVPASLDRIGIGAQAALTPGIFMNGLLLWPTVWNAALTADEMYLLSRGLDPLRMRRGHVVFHVRMLSSADAIDMIGALALTANGGASLAFVNDVPPGGLVRLLPRGRNRDRARIAA